MSLEKITNILDGITAEQSGTADLHAINHLDFLTKQCEMLNNEVGTLDVQCSIDGCSDLYDCVVCKNKGVIWEVKEIQQTLPTGEALTEYERVATMCECMPHRKKKRRIFKSGLSRLLENNRLDNFETAEDWQKKLHTSAKCFLDNPNRTMFFVGGQSGAGKTHICVAICGELLDSGADVHYMQWRNEAPQLKAIVTDYEEYQRKIDFLKNIPVLYIDDLFKMGKVEGQALIKPTTADINLAFEIINSRLYKGDRATIISSELSLKELISIDESIAGRIAEHTIKNGCCINISKDISKNYRLRGVIEL